jgi:hypothetical protein
MAVGSSTRTLTILVGLSIAACAGEGGRTPSVTVEKSKTPFPTGYTTARSGDMHDFDEFAGGWRTRQRRLKARGVGSADWEEFPATLCMSLYLGGMATVDELYFPTKGWAGLTLRVFDLNTRQWSIYWVSSASGKTIRGLSLTTSSELMRPLVVAGPIARGRKSPKVVESTAGDCRPSVDWADSAMSPIRPRRSIAAIDSPIAAMTPMTR